MLFASARASWRSIRPLAPETERLSELPEGWCWASMDALAQVVGGITKDSKQTSGRSVPYDVVARRAGDPVSTYAEPTRAREVLKWQATQGLDEIIASAWAWHSSHPDGFTAR